MAGVVLLMLLGTFSQSLIHLEWKVLYQSERIRVEVLNIFMLSIKVRHFGEPPERLVVSRVHAISRWHAKMLIFSGRFRRAFSELTGYWAYMSRTWLKHFILVILHVEYAFHDVFKVLKVDSKEMSMTFDAHDNWTCIGLWISFTCYCLVLHLRLKYHLIVLS